MCGGYCFILIIIEHTCEQRWVRCLSLWNADNAGGNKKLNRDELHMASPNYVCIHQYMCIFVHVYIDIFHCYVYIFIMAHNHHIFFMIGLKQGKGG